MADPSDLPPPLVLQRLSDTSLRFPPDDEKAGSGRVLYGGQILAQMLMAADPGPERSVESIHVVFARAGTYAESTDYDVEQMSAGRTFTSWTVTCRQGERLLARGLVLCSAAETDFIRYPVEAARVGSAPERGEPDGRVFPGSISATDDGSDDDPGQERIWIRHTERLDSPLANQAVLAWATDGFLISAALGPHPALDESQAHLTLSTGVMSHTVNFHRPVDVSSWLLLVNQSVYAGGGRAFGTSQVFTGGGELVASYSQDAMIRPRQGQGAL
jgi:acyl-CoA thioesterase II